MRFISVGGVREGGQGGPFLEGAGAAGGFIRAAGHRTLSSGGAASKALTTKKTEDRCYSRRNPEGLSTFRAPWILALMPESTSVFFVART